MLFNILTKIGEPKDNKKRYLLAAARAIDSLRLAGSKPADQVMAFPRTGETAIPLAVKRAQVFEAMAMSDPQITKHQKHKAAGVSSVSVGNASISYSKSITGLADLLASSEAQMLLRPWLSSWAVFK